MPTTAEKRASLPPPARERLLRHPQSLGHRHRRAICRAWASRRWRRRARASPGRAGLADGGVTRDVMLAHIAELSAAADVPMNADFEGGYAHEPAGVAESVRLCCATGVSGLSIEDFTGDRAKPLYDFDMAVARIKAAREAIDKAGGDVLLTGRSEGFIRDRPTWTRPSAASRPTRRPAPTASTRRASRRASRSRPWSRRVAPKPVNLLMGGPSELTVRDIAGLGVRRISIGGALARAAWGGTHAHHEADRRRRQLQGLRRRGAGRRHRQGVEVAARSRPQTAPALRSLAISPAANPSSPRMVSVSAPMAGAGAHGSSSPGQRTEGASSRIGPLGCSAVRTMAPSRTNGFSSACVTS